MQAVSNDYINELNKQIIGGVTAEVDILNVDIDKQSSAIFTQSSNINYSVYGGGGVEGVTERNSLLVIREVRSPELATFELNHTKADGFYDTGPPYNRMLGSVLSSVTADSNGEYPIPANTFFKLEVPLYGLDKTNTPPITAYFGKNTGKVKFEFGTSDTYVKTVNADNGWIVIDDVPFNLRNFSEIKVTFLTLLKPQQRARANRLFFGTAMSVTGNEVTNLEYKDINDNVMLELPNRNVTITISNLNGEYNQEKEYGNPSFKKHHTQILPRVGQSLGGGIVEWISLGRYFLVDYTVDGKGIRLNATSALGLLNEYPQANWSNRNSTIFQMRFWEVYGHDYYAPETAYTRFGIAAEHSMNGNLISVNACPAMPLAQAFQILGNWTGGYIRIERGSFFLDFSINERGEDTVRKISGDIILDKIEWSAETVINKIEVISHVRTNDITDATLTISPESHTNYAYITADFPIASIPGGYENISAYSAYVNTYEMEETDFPVKLYGMDTNTQTITVSSGNGETITVDNPMMSDRDGITARAFAEKLYSELKYNITAQFSHRGFLELDCGDVIMIETQPGVLVKARVIENNLTINQGSVSGSTKVRRLS